MPWRRIVYPRQAVLRLRQRRFTRQQVRHFLATGARRPQSSTAWLADGALDRWPARLVFRENADQITVITVMWTA